jgi:hypothetical protein
MNSKEVFKIQIYDFIYQCNRRNSDSFKIIRLVMYIVYCIANLITFLNLKQIGVIS